jgi:ATP adenylyltransferase
MKMSFALLFLSTFIGTVCTHPISYVYAPWRDQGASLIQEQCCFCKEIKATKDDHYLILSRTQDIIVQINPKPYTPGSLLIYPIKHVMYPEDLEPIVWADMFFIAKQAMDLLTRYLGVKSFSIGMNIGLEAHGSIPGHLHLHIVPRYKKERPGFLEAACNTRLVKNDLNKMYKEMKKLIRGK